MTREKAIECLNYQNETFFGGQSEALKMAISALSAEGDLISRQAVNDVIAEIKSWYWQADRQALAKDPCVVDSMVDMFIRTIYKHIGKAERSE